MMKEYSDSNLVKKVKEGNMNAFRILVDKYKRSIYSLCYQMIGNAADADDLSQEAFIKAHQSIHKFRMQASFSTWLRRIAYNLTLNHIKMKQRRRENLFNFGNEMNRTLEYATIAAQEDPRDQLERSELSRKISEAMFCLPAAQRAAVELVIQEGLSYKEAAKIQGCPEGTVFWRIYQARKTLKVKLEPYKYCEYGLKKMEDV